jgi:hypothetical protein
MNRHIAKSNQGIRAGRDRVKEANWALNRAMQQTNYR